MGRTESGSLVWGCATYIFHRLLTELNLTALIFSHLIGNLANAVIRESFALTRKILRANKGNIASKIYVLGIFLDVPYRIVDSSTSSTIMLLIIVTNQCSDF